MNFTMPLEPDGILEGEDAPSCNATVGFNITYEIELGQGEDGYRNQSCSLNTTLEVDNEQGEDGERDESGEDGGRGGRKSGCPVPPDGVIISPLADQGDYAPMNESSCPDLDPRFPVSPLDEQGDYLRPEVSSCPISNITIKELPDDPDEQDFSSSLQKSKTPSASKSKITASSTSSVNSTLQSEAWSAFISKLTASTTFTECAPPKVSTLGDCSLLVPMEIIRSKPSKGFAWSCGCENQQRRTVSPTVVCGETMCPNHVWKSASSSSEESVSHPPDLPTLTPVKTSEEPLPGPKTTSTYTPCQCFVPTNTQYGSGSSKTFTLPRLGGPHQNPWPKTVSCECDYDGEKTKVPLQTVCGEKVCPKPVGQTSIAVPDDCPESACVPPLDTEFGQCHLRTYEYTKKGESMTGYACNCNMQPSTRVNLASDCSGGPVCTNQKHLVTRVPGWTDIVPQGEQTLACWSYLPSLLFFELPMQTVAPFLEGDVACMCDVADDPDAESPHSFRPPFKGCGGSWLCPNSDHLKVERRSAGLNDSFAVEDGTWHGSGLQLPATATAVGPLMPVVTDATPGSIPLAAIEPTKAVEI